MTVETNEAGERLHRQFSLESLPSRRPGWSMDIVVTVDDGRPGRPNHELFEACRQRAEAINRGEKPPAAEGLSFVEWYTKWPMG
jgi:hypothetical protein